MGEPLFPRFRALLFCRVSLPDDVLEGALVDAFGAVRRRERRLEVTGPDFRVSCGMPPDPEEVRHRFASIVEEPSIAHGGPIDERLGATQVWEVDGANTGAGDPMDGFNEWVRTIEVIEGLAPGTVTLDTGP